MLVVIAHNPPVISLEQMVIDESKVVTDHLPTLVNPDLAA